MFYSYGRKQQCQQQDNISLKKSFPSQLTKLITMHALRMKSYASKFLDTQKKIIDTQEAQCHYHFIAVYLLCNKLTSRPILVETQLDLMTPIRLFLGYLEIFNSISFDASKNFSALFFPPFHFSSEFFNEVTTSRRDVGGSFEPAIF